MLNKLPENYKFVLKAVGPTLAIIVMTILVAKFGLGKVLELRTRAETLNRNITVLTEKSQVLRNLEGTVENGANAVSVALPDSNPSLVVLSQLKSLAIQNTVVVSGLKSGPEVKDATGLSRADISFDVEGTKSNVFSFVKNIPLTAPINTVDQIKLNQTNASTRASLIVRIYWAPLPTQLPAITEQIRELSQSDLEVITELQSLVQPQFVTLAPSEGGKLDPFTP